MTQTKQDVALLPKEEINEKEISYIVSEVFDE
jgi:hypothetical protein